MDLKRVGKIRQKYKDIIKGYVRKVQSMFTEDKAYYNIVDLIKHIILLYYYRTFESKILTDDEQEEFMDFLTRNSKRIVDYSWKLIFDSREDSLEVNKFVDKVHDHPNVLLLIQVEGDTVIGGYTKVGWSKHIYNTYKFEDVWTADKDAFAFYFKSPHKKDPFISNVKQDTNSFSNAICHSKGYYALFGNCWLFCMKPFNKVNNGNTFDSRFNKENNYENYPYGWTFITGKKKTAVSDVVIEVFQIEIK